MSNKLVKPNSICLICGKKGTHNIFLTSGQSIVSATGTQLGNFLYKIICEEPCYSISEVICQQCYLLMDRLDTYQARAEEIHSHISDRYKYTKLGLIGCRKRISDLIVHSLSNIKSFKNGTILNVSDELSVTVFHETLPRPENRVICDRVALNSSQKDRLLQSSHLKQHNSEIFRSKAKKRLYLHNSNKSKPIIRNEVQTSMNGNGTDIFDSHKKTNFHKKVGLSIKRKLPPSLKENAVPKKPKEKLISQLVDSSATSLLNDHASVCNSVTAHQNNSLEIPFVNKKKSININEKCESSEAAQLIYNTLKDVLSNQQSHKLCWPNSNKDISTSEQTQIMETVKDDYLSLSNSPLFIRSPPEEENTSGLNTVNGESSEGENEFDNASSTSIDSVNSSSSSSNESSSTDSSSDSSSISSDDNTSDEENETVELEEKVTNDADLKDSNLLDSKKSLLDNVTDYAILTQNDIKNIKKEIVTDAEKSTNHSEDKNSYKKVLKKKMKRQPTNNQSPSPSKKKTHVKNTSAHVDTLDPQFAHAVLMQNSLASSLLQSFLSTSLWMNSSESPKKKNNNSLNKNNLKESQNLSSDEIVCDSLSNAVGSINDKEKRLELKNTGQSYINTKGKLVDAKRVLPQDCSRCPLKCNGRLSDEKRREIFTEYWGLADYNLQREYLASHMDREERMGPSGLPRNVILYYLTYKESKIQVCRQFFLKTLDISEKASRLVIEKKLKL